MRKVRSAIILGIIATFMVFNAAPLTGRAPAVPQVISEQQFTRIPALDLVETPPSAVVVTPAPIPTVVPTPSPTQKPRSTPKPQGRSVSGKASWYCNYDTSRYRRSACHRSYPDLVRSEQLYAAACQSLRQAMGASWRGKFVTATNASGVSVRVQLIDYCASTTKVIDLYYDAMDVLVGNPGVAGTAPVTVRW